MADYIQGINLDMELGECAPVRQLDTTYGDIGIEILRSDTLHYRSQFLRGQNPHCYPQHAKHKQPQCYNRQQHPFYQTQPQRAATLGGLSIT